MGAWGPGLYADDLALDLRTAVSTVCRLPLEGPALVGVLSDAFPTRSDDGSATTFWLVVADQLHRRGIATEAVERALGIIDDGSDLRSRAELGMSEVDARRRGRELQRLRARLIGPLPDVPRRTLDRPQPLVVHPGEVHVFEVDAEGAPRNPYFTDPAKARFDPVGWGALVVLRSGHHWDHLAWYEVAPAARPSRRRPTLEEAVAAVDTGLAALGTLSRPHARRMGFQLLGRVDPPSTPPPAEDDITAIVVSDISVANIIARPWRTGAGE